MGHTGFLLDDVHKPKLKMYDTDQRGFVLLFDVISIQDPKFIHD